MNSKPSISEDPETRFRRHLPKSHDMTLIVLKGHLLIEEQLDGLLSNLLPNPAAIKPIRLDFFGRLCLARALVGVGSFKDMFDRVEKLNGLRNKLAHQLEPAQIDTHINNFLRSIEDPETPIAEFEKEATSRRLKRCIAFLCGALSGVQDGYAASRNVGTAK